MIFESTPIEGVVVVRPEPRSDARGTFARVYCREEFAGHGIELEVVQANVSVNADAGTVRGLHFQRRPHAEAKLVRATRGAVFDVAVDLRAGSPTFLRWFGVVLDEHERAALHVPAGCAHGYQALTDAAEVTYLVSEYYTPSSEAGVRYDDPAIGIAWPLDVTALSPKDATWPLLGEGGEHQLP